MATRRTLLAALAGLAAPTVAVAAPALPEPDAELLRLSVEYRSLDRRFLAACAAQHAIPRPWTPAAEIEWNRLDDIACAASAPMGRIEERVAIIQAQTERGVWAKAEAERLSRPTG